MLRLAALAALLALTAQHAYAEGSSRDFCANRPGRGNPPCVLDPGRLQVETSFADYTHDRQSGTSTDTTLFGDLALRLGVTTTGEVQLAFSPDIKTTVKGFGAASSETGYGDLTLAWRQSLRNPDGSGASIALQPFVTAPTGKGGFSAGGWQGGVAAPMAFALPDGFNLALTPQLAAVRNTSGPGAHMSATGVVGLSHPLGPFSLGAD